MTHTFRNINPLPSLRLRKLLRKLYHKTNVQIFALARTQILLLLTLLLLSLLVIVNIIIIIIIVVLCFEELTNQILRTLFSYDKILHYRRIWGYFIRDLQEWWWSVLHYFVLLAVSMVTRCLLLVISHYEVGIGRSWFRLSADWQTAFRFLPGTYFHSRRIHLQTETSV
jgi:hypothetical protein